ESDTLSSQDVSLVVGYRGSNDSNMIAILILHTAGSQNAQVTLWINKAGNWQPECVLISKAPKKGKLSVSRQGNKLVITCDELRSVTKKLNPVILDGAIGVRCTG